MLTLSRSSILRSAIAALCVPGAVLAQQAQQAQTGPQAEAQSLEEITVTGTRIVRSGMITPVPTTAVQADELQNMSAGPLFDALVQLPPFFSNQAPEQVNGGQNSGGSNLNLRGAGLNRTLVLLDGRRVVPTNRFGAVDVAMFPEELISSVEVVTGGASASYGTDAVAGVVNFKLDTDFEGYKGHLQAGQTTYSDGDTYEAGFAFGTRIGERGHLIGSFHQPIGVLADTGTLRTLPPRELGAGLAEVIKYGVIVDAPFFDWLEEHVDDLRRLDSAALTHAIRRSCEIKAAIVAEDEREQGRRALLNLGHTFGHALESIGNYERWLHGEAVAIGIVLAARTSVALGWLVARDGDRIERLLARAGLPTKASGVDAAELLEHMRGDKKADRSGLKLILIRALGASVVTRAPAEDTLRAVLVEQLA